MNLLYILLIFGISFLALACEKTTPPDDSTPEEYIPTEIETWNIAYRFDVEDPYIYAALDWQGLWRKNFIEESEWEYIGFADTTGYSPALDVDVYGKDILVARWREKVWHSTDGGETWFKSDSGLTTSRTDEIYISNVKRSPHDPYTVFASEGSKALFRSTNGGHYWKLIQGRAGSSDHSQIVWHPYKHGEAWIFGYGATHEAWFYGVEDYGLTLKVEIDVDTLTGTSIVGVGDIAFDAGNSDIIYIIAGTHFFMSEDAGYTWQITGSDITDSVRVYSLIGDPRQANSLFFTDEKSVYYSNDGLQTFRFIERIIDEGAIWSLPGQVIENNQLFIGTSKGIYHINIEDVH